jgi:hypothetical protein
MNTGSSYRAVRRCPTSYLSATLDLTPNDIRMRPNLASPLCANASNKCLRPVRPQSRRTSQPVSLYDATSL